MPIRIGGKEIPQVSHEDCIVLPRGEDALCIRAKAINDFDEFSKICPLPEPPGKLTKDGWVPNPDDKTYRQRVEQHNIQRVGWMVVRSITEMALSDGEFFPVEWDKVQVENPKTWSKWQEDLRDSGFTDVECNLVLALVIDVNSLNEDKLKEARDSFILGQEQAAKAKSSQTSEQRSSSSGEHVSEPE